MSIRFPRLLLSWGPLDVSLCRLGGSWGRLRSLFGICWGTLASLVGHRDDLGGSGVVVDAVKAKKANVAKACVSQRELDE
eukprot:7053454-Pyramimonas_sp.AAC.1